jgi:septum formation protein
VTPVVLASKSPSRQAILRAAGVPFEVAASGVDEDAVKARLLGAGQGPREIADHLAEAKAVAVSKAMPGAIVVGADQTLDLGGELYDKVETMSEGRARLRTLRSRSHLLHSAVVVAQHGMPIWRYLESPRLVMRAASDAFIDAYLTRHGEALLGSVGVYQLENDGAQLFDEIDGDYFAILGLPLLPLLALLRDKGALAA